LFSQRNYGRTFEHGPWKGRLLEEAVELASKLGCLPAGLTLDVMMVNGEWVTLANRTLAVARMANLSQVAINDVGPSGLNKLQKLLRGSDLLTPIKEAVMRCK
jgi:hypothetical protein